MTQLQASILSLFRLPSEKRTQKLQALNKISIFIASGVTIENSIKSDLTAVLSTTNICDEISIK